jgi:polyphosphate glucokinase
MNYFGIDIGCTAIKFGEVSLDREIETHNFDMLLIPQTQRTQKYTDALLRLIQHAEEYKGIGVGFPSVVWEDGIMNLDIEFNDIWQKLVKVFRQKNVPHFAINDADAAGFAEVYHPGASELRKGLTIVLTLGTGIGSGIFLNGKLCPNSELGMIEINGMMAETFAAASVKHREGLSMEEWASRLQRVISQIEIILSPDHILLGGGISSDYEDYCSLLSTKRSTLGPAYYRNQAGVIGAAMYAAYRSNEYMLELNNGCPGMTEAIKI